MPTKHSQKHLFPKLAPVVRSHLPADAEFGRVAGQMSTTSARVVHVMRDWMSSLPTLEVGLLLVVIVYLQTAG